MSYDTSTPAWFNIRKNVFPVQEALEILVLQVVTKSVVLEHILMPQTGVLTNAPLVFAAVYDGHTRVADDGMNVGSRVGLALGSVVGGLVGCGDGEGEGTVVGEKEGVPCEGNTVGTEEGREVGIGVGSLGRYDGCMVGNCVGTKGTVMKEDPAITALPAHPPGPLVENAQVSRIVYTWQGLPIGVL